MAGAPPPLVSQSVKEVLDSLLADNIVDTDKIGTSVLYWAFPSKASQIVRRQVSVSVSVCASYA
jgi:hypothetical protein